MFLGIFAMPAFLEAGSILLFACPPLMRGVILAEYHSKGVAEVVGPIFWIPFMASHL